MKLKKATGTYMEKKKVAAQTPSFTYFNLPGWSDLSQSSA